MCAGRQHHYRVLLNLGGKVQQDKNIVISAIGVADAISKADGWAHKYHPNVPVTFSIRHMGYSSDASAHEHGAYIYLTEERDPNENQGRSSR